MNRELLMDLESTFMHEMKLQSKKTCSVCLCEVDELYQRKTCKDCLSKEFKPLRRVIDYIRPVKDFDVKFTKEEILDFSHETQIEIFENNPDPSNWIDKDAYDSAKNTFEFKSRMTTGVV